MIEIFLRKRKKFRITKFFKDARFFRSGNLKKTIFFNFNLKKNTLALGIQISRDYRLHPLFPEIPSIPLPEQDSLERLQCFFIRFRIWPINV